jgi:RimJ/RimL family protein N-acetyltransferase
MIYAETERLTLRSLEKSDLPRIVELIGDWQVARWLTSVPHPYNLSHAEEFYERIAAAVETGKPEYFLLELKRDKQQIGAVGLHPPRLSHPKRGEHVIGYWLGKEYWGRGLMTEALTPVITHAFARQDIALLTAATEPANTASKNVLKKAGLECIGIFPLSDKNALRGGPDVTRWELTRTNYETRMKAA